MTTIKVKHGDEVLFEESGKLLFRDAFARVNMFLVDYIYEFDKAHNASEDDLDNNQIKLEYAFSAFEKESHNLRRLNTFLRNYNLVVYLDRD